jgi:ParB/RepB/Spo0J family partition protein
MQQQMIPINAIFPRTEGLLRTIKPEYVKLLAESINEIGLQTPISVRVIPCEEGTPFRHNGNTYQVAAGNHRLEACKQLGWSEIPAFLLDLSDVDRLLWEIDENLMRGELTKLERAEHLKKRKAVYLMKYPETKNGGDRKSEKRRKKNQNPDSGFCSQPPCFVDDTAAKTGMARTVIAEAIHRAEKIDEPVKQAIADMPEIADNGQELDALAAVEPEEQKKAVEAVKSGRAKNIREATKGAKKRKAKPTPSDEEIVRCGIVAAVKQCRKTVARRIVAVHVDCDGDKIQVAVKFAGQPEAANDAA